MGRNMCKTRLSMINKIQLISNIYMIIGRVKLVCSKEIVDLVNSFCMPSPNLFLELHHELSGYQNI